ncbi:MAG: BON domain-containing protein [Steroidobacteraceae bacterium]
MSTRNTVLSLTVIAALLGGVAVAQDVDLNRDHPKAFVKDSVITTKVKTKLAAEHLSSLARIRVNTDADGIVWLSGTAPTRAAAKHAETVARETEGVAGVKNGIQIRND